MKTARPSASQRRIRDRWSASPPTRTGRPATGRPQLRAVSRRAPVRSRRARPRAPDVGAVSCRASCDTPRRKGRSGSQGDVRSRGAVPGLRHSRACHADEAERSCGASTRATAAPTCGRRQTPEPHPVEELGDRPPRLLGVCRSLAVGPTLDQVVASGESYFSTIAYRPVLPGGRVACGGRRQRSAVLRAVPDRNVCRRACRCPARSPSPLQPLRRAAARAAPLRDSRRAPPRPTASTPPASRTRLRLPGGRTAEPPGRGLCRTAPPAVDQDRLARW